MANKTIYAYSSNSVRCSYDITINRNGNDVIITASGTLYGSSGSSNSSNNLYAHVCYGVEKANTGTVTRHVESWGTRIGTGVLIVSAPLNVTSIPTTGKAFSASWTINHPDAMNLSNVSLFLSSSASSQSARSGTAYMFTGERSTSISDTQLRYYTQNLSIGAASYTVTYNKGSNGTGTNTTDTKAYGTTLALQGAIFTREGYYQSGWATTDGGSKVYELNGNYTANAAITLYPVWTIDTYTVSYNKGNKGAGTNTSDTKTYGVSLTLKGAIFTRTGYTQTGWSITDGGAKAYDLGAAYTSNSAVTLYPYWTINTWTVSYNKGANGTGTNTTATKTYGVSLTLLGAIFTREGYTQTGWSTIDGGAKVYDLNGTYTTNSAITLYPYWTADAPSVIYDIVSIDDGVGQIEYEVYIDNGTSWDKYEVYVDNGTSWDRIGVAGATYQGFSPSGSDGLLDANGNTFNVREG